MGDCHQRPHRGADVWFAVQLAMRVCRGSRESHYGACPGRPTPSISSFSGRAFVTCSETRVSPRSVPSTLCAVKNSRLWYALGLAAAGDEGMFRRMRAGGVSRCCRSWRGPVESSSRSWRCRGAPQLEQLVGAHGAAEGIVAGFLARAGRGSVQSREKARAVRGEVAFSKRLRYSSNKASLPLVASSSRSFRPARDGPRRGSRGTSATARA